MMVRQADKLLQLSYIEDESSLVWSFCLAESVIQSLIILQPDPQDHHWRYTGKVSFNTRLNWDPADLFWKLLRPATAGGTLWPKVSNVDIAATLHTTGLRAIAVSAALATRSNESGFHIGVPPHSQTTDSTTSSALIDLEYHLLMLPEPFSFRKASGFFSWYLTAIGDEISLRATTWSWHWFVLNPDTHERHRFSQQRHDPSAKTTFTVTRHSQDTDTLNLTSPVINSIVEDFRFVIKLSLKTGIIATHKQSAIAPYMPPLALQGVLTPYGFIMSSGSSASVSMWLWIWPNRPSNS